MTDSCRTGFTASREDDSIEVSGIGELPPLTAAFSLEHPDQIDQALLFPKPGVNLPEFLIVIANDDCLSVGQNGVDVRYHQFRNVRDPIQNEIPVRSDQRRQVDVAIIDAQIISLANQPF